MRCVALIFVLLLIVPVTCSYSQETTGNLQGRIFDQTGKPIQLVQIAVSGPSLQGEKTVVTSSKGFFHFLALPIGSYSVKISHVSYQGIELENIQVRLGKTTDIGAMTLLTEVYETEAIEVVAEAPMLDPVSTVLGGNLDSDEFVDLPISRDYSAMTTLLPHVNESFLGDDVGFAGGTGMENKYYIDGVDNTNVVSGNSSTELPYNFIRELQVRSGGYQAEYRGSLGGAVEVITNSGGNELHGQVFGFYINDRLTADARQSVTDPFQGSYALYDVGLSLGGPFIRDKLWYYIAYNPNFSNEEAEIPGQGIHDYDGISHRFATKLTWRLNRKNDIELSVYGDPTTFEGAAPTAFFEPPEALENPDPNLRKIEQGGVSALLNGRHWLRDNFLLQSKISFVKQRYSNLPLTARGASEGLYIDLETNKWSGGSFYDLETDNLIMTFGLSGTWIKGNHMLKTGLEYREIKVDYVDNAEFIMHWAESPTEDLYRYQTMTTDGTVKNRLPSAFLQDSWRAWDRLTLNLGVRWDGQYIYANDELAQRFNDQWQPRAGFTVQLDEKRKHQVFASYGRFYQELSMQAPAAYLLPGSTYYVVIYDHDPRIDPTIGSGDMVVSDYVSHGHEEVESLVGQHFDEFTLGYEQLLTQRSKVTLRGVFRTVRNGLEDGMLPSGEWVWGNPGSGGLSEFPRMKREYTALDVTYQHSGGAHYNLLASYTLSRNRGNYTGIFDLDTGGDGFTNAMPSFDLLETLEQSYGVLPNDRTHSFKLSGSYKVGYGITVGTTALWQSGTPLNEFGSAIEDPVYNVFIVPRGEAGRMNSIWDFSLRFTYDLSTWWKAPVHPKLLLDLLHIGSPQEPVNYVQVRYLGRDDDGNHTIENPLYMQPVTYQPPFAIRLGMTMDF